ncbi:type IX secretion system plug protein [Algoriphagus hitonicola]|uniref:Type 9 secretion system plug protein N-terminal domain-containing protein n=1 Tax=Algoriphagus hitonicola TaxID=435880 RepID=A0A1I2VR92_9BACT|nr:DUF5103 domain-containing protein [Algoriphagus hitonicola]SFG91865.1 protein of unknown function [Algoriphagus hitonicola]
MYQARTYLLLFFFALNAGNLFGQIEDKVYKDHIYSVRLFPVGSDYNSQLNAPVVSISDSRPLVLHFDDLAYDPELYSVKLVHCDADWKQSQLKNNDFLSTFNEFTIQDYEYSVNTRIPYIHYTFQIPPVTKSGNYIAKVYRGRDEEDVVLTRRFMVYEEFFTVGASIVPTSQTADRQTSQQINVNVNYSNGDIMDPNNQIRVVIRQNQRWGNAKSFSKPTFLNESSKLMRFESFDGENTFSAGNEFRFVDLRFIRAAGVNIANITVETDVIYADAKIDSPRPNQAYSQYLDLNGQYVVFNNDRPGGNPEMDSQYILTNFYLKYPQTSEPIYLMGAFTAWGKSLDAQMKWNEELELYETAVLLKQGWYDYQYALGEELDTKPFEGSYFQTENEYEVMVYYRALGSRYDQLVGYVYLQPNRRRL